MKRLYDECIDKVDLIILAVIERLNNFFVIKYQKYLEEEWDITLRDIFGGISVCACAQVKFTLQAPFQPKTRCCRIKQVYYVIHVAFDHLGSCRTRHWGLVMCTCRRHWRRWRSWFLVHFFCFNFRLTFFKSFVFFESLVWSLLVLSSNCGVNAHLDFWDINDTEWALNDTRWRPTQKVKRGREREIEMRGRQEELDTET